MNSGFLFPTFIGRMNNCDIPFWAVMNAERQGATQALFSKTQYYQYYQ